MQSFDGRVREAQGKPLKAADIDTVQVNIGLKCNQTCEHCHVVSSPSRTEAMTWDTMQKVLDAARRAGSRLLDITGGAPELHPRFRDFVVAARNLGLDVMVRTNLTVIFQPGMADLPAFFRDQRVQLVASLPCYLEDNVDKQRGNGVYRDSIRALQALNAVGYGTVPDLPLSLVYNPVGAHLPPPQHDLEAAYRERLLEDHGIRFTHLWTITNMPIGRFWGDLRKQGKAEAYAQTLREAFNPATLGGLMCRHQINVRWDGTIFDCDFNLALHKPVDHGMPTHIDDFDPQTFALRRIATGNHCFGCTAGAGSSCGGSLA